MALKTSVWTGHAKNFIWQSPGNWSQGAPAATQSALFKGNATLSISLGGAGPATAGSLTINGDQVSFTGGTLTLAAPQPANALGRDLRILNGGSVTVAANATINASTLVTVGDVLAGAFTPGALTVLGHLTTQVVEALDGTVSVLGAGAVLTTTAEFVVGMQASISNGATLSGAGTDLAEVQVGAVQSNGDGTLSVGGAGSAIDIDRIYLGDGYAGTLNATGGATVRLDFLDAGEFGDGFVNLSGAGTSLTTNGMLVGSAVPPIASVVSVTNGASLSIGANGLTLEEGHLRLDGSAQFSTGSFISLAGQIEAASPAAGQSGLVNITSDISIGENADGSVVTNVYADKGATLKFSGTISGDTVGTLQIGAGHVVLANGANSYGATQIYGGVVELAARGAAGSGSFTFLHDPHRPQPAVLQLDRGVSFANLIVGFGAHDWIDVRGFAFAGDHLSVQGNTLTLANGASSISLTFASGTNLAGVVLVDDHHGGAFLVGHA